MRAVVQRVRRASVTVGRTVCGEIGPGYVLLLGFGGDDALSMRGGAVWTRFLRKIVDVRLFPDTDGPINAGLAEHGGGILVVSQFTLYADLRKGRRPSFAGASRPEDARELYTAFVTDLRLLWPNVAEGVFGADMDVSLVNWGPVTICLDSQAL